MKSVHNRSFINRFIELQFLRDITHLSMDTTLLLCGVLHIKQGHNTCMLGILERINFLQNMHLTVIL